MTETSRRKVLGGIGVGLTGLFAGCTELSTSSSDTSTGQSGDDYEYVRSTEITIIGEGEESQPAVTVKLTDFAVSKHSAASTVHIQNEDGTIGQSSIVNSKSLTIPVSESDFTTVVVTDDEGQELSSYDS